MFLIKKMKHKEFKGLWTLFKFMQHLFPRRGKKNHRLLNFRCLLSLSLWDIIKSLEYTFTPWWNLLSHVTFILSVQTKPSHQHVPGRGFKPPLNSLYAVFSSASCPEAASNVSHAQSSGVSHTLQQWPSDQQRGLYDVIGPFQVLFIFLEGPRSF